MRYPIGSATCVLTLGILAVQPLAAGASAPGAHLGPVEVAQLSASTPTAMVRYGPDPLQVGELRVPHGRGPFPVAIIVHGGCFTKGFATLSYMAPLAAALAQRGVATWNVEYRQVGDSGGGWPGTFVDWAAIAIDGPGDLVGWVGADAAICRKPVIVPLFGGTVRDVPERYAEGSPRSLLPLGVPQVLVASMVLTESDANAYQRDASAKHDRVSVVLLRDAGHFDMLAPGNAAWSSVEPLILQAAGIR